MDFKDRHRMFCQGFMIPFGSIIKIPGWGTYEVREEGMFDFYSKKNKPDDYMYGVLIKRGFSFYEED